MSFKIEASEYLLKQLAKLDEKNKKLIAGKIELIKENPFHFKRIHSKKFSKVFRARLNLKGKEARLIYVVLEPNILLVCLLERKKNYRDLENYLSKI